MGLQDGSGTRGSVVQTLIALAIILLGFQIADVAPIRAERAEWPAVAPEAPYVPLIRAVDEALARKDGTAAGRAWQEAYSAALASTGWEGLVAAGDAALRIGEVSDARAVAEAKARTTYLAAFFRARQQGAVEGVSRSADAFSALGDHEVAERCRRVAAELAARETPRREGRTAAGPAAR